MNSRQIHNAYRESVNQTISETHAVEPGYSERSFAVHMRQLRQVDATMKFIVRNLEQAIETRHMPATDVYALLQLASLCTDLVSAALDEAD